MSGNYLLRWRRVSRQS